MRVLMTGGAGYVGSACYRSMRARGIEAFVLDDLSEGHAEAVEPTRLRTADLRDTEAVARVLRDDRIDHVVHFAGLTSVPDSIRIPSEYWSVNVDGSRSLLEAMRATGVSKIVFSSTAAVYAHGSDEPLREGDLVAPATPYGTSKLAVEYLLQAYADAYGIAATALRYFNASGADADGCHGEAHRHETHVIPLLVKTALRQRPAFTVFGDSWRTHDGSCVRDFVSVQDLAEAHRLALAKLRPGRFTSFNLGSGHGSSVFELIKAAEEIVGEKVRFMVADPRPGDPAVLLADIALAEAGLGWRPTHSDMRSIMASAVRWHRGHPDGYEVFAARTLDRTSVRSADCSSRSIV